MLAARAEVLVRGDNCVMVREGDSINLVNTKGIAFSQLMVQSGFTQELVENFISHSACKEDILAAIEKDKEGFAKHFTTV